MLISIGERRIIDVAILTTSGPTPYGRTPATSGNRMSSSGDHVDFAAGIERSRFVTAVAIGACLGDGTQESDNHV